MGTDRDFAKGVAGGRRNGVASDYFRSLPFSSFSFRFLPFFSVSIFVLFGCFFRAPIFSVSSVFFRFFPFSSIFRKKKRGDTVRETPFAKPRTDVGTGVRGHVGVREGNLWADSGGERRDTHTHTGTHIHRGTYKQMLHLPFPTP